MSNFLKFLRANLIMVFLPFIPLIEGVFVYPIGSVKAIENTFPFLQGFVLLFLIFKYRLNNNFLGLFVLLTILLNIIILVPYHEVIPYSITFTLAYVLIARRKNIDCLYKDFKIFTLSYTIISIIIYFIRLIEYSFNLTRTRGGSNIYGANELTGLVLLTLVFSFYSKKSKVIDSINYLFILLFLSMIFIRRVSIVGVILLLLVYFFLNTKTILFKKKSFKKIVFILFLSSGLIFVFYKFDFISTIQMRFESAQNTSSNSIQSFTEETSYARTLLWSDGIKAFKENSFFGLGAGNFKLYSFQSTAHSLFINNLAEFGYFGFFLNFLYIIPLLFIIKSKINLNNKLISFTSYFVFLLICNISGINLFQNTGYVSGFSTLGFFLIIRLISIKK